VPSRARRAALAARSAVEEQVAFMAPARRLRLAIAGETVERHAGGRPLRLLDAGCGDGLVALTLARRHPDWTVLGVDLRERLLDGARARAAARGLTNVRFARADLTVGVPEGGFDAVLAVECLTEIPDDDVALRTLADAIAPGGLLVAQVAERSWRPVLRGSDATWRDEVRHGYDAAELAAKLRRVDLDVLEVRPTYRGIVAAAQEVRDRIKDARLAVRAAAYPAMRAAVVLERRGITWGTARALVAVARRPDAAHGTGSGPGPG
jgi:SAM-dependent methyltransferase